MTDQHIDTDESPKRRALTRRVDELSREVQEVLQSLMAIRVMLEERDQH